MTEMFLTITHSHESFMGLDPCIGFAGNLLHMRKARNQNLPRHLFTMFFSAATPGRQQKEDISVHSKVWFIYNLPYIKKVPERELYSGTKAIQHFVWKVTDESWSITELPVKVLEGEKHGLAVKTKETLQYLSSSLVSEPRDSSIAGIRTLYLAL